MAYYRYKARDTRGASVSGFVEAPNESAAVNLIRSRQLMVITLKSTSSAKAGFVGVKPLQKVRFGDIVNFTRQLSTMVVAGLSLPESMRIIREQIGNPAMGEVISELERHIVGGGNLADALLKYPNHFSPIYIALVRSGEASGTLEKVLERLADTQEAQREFRSKVTGAMIYPVIIMIAMFAVIMIMMTVVVPKLTGMYVDFGISLPASTQLLIGMSTFFVHFWWLIIALIFGTIAFVKRWRKTHIGLHITDSLLLKLPVFGTLTTNMILVDFTRTLSMLITAGVHIIDGLKVLRNALGNVLFRDAIDELSHKIEKGFPMGETIGQFKIFPPIVSQMVKVGEETGKLDDTLLKLSKYFESESDHLVKGMTVAIEPIIMVVLGVGVGFIVMAIITPIYSLTNQLQ